MEQPTLESLARRLERVERENRRLKLIGLLTGAMLASIIVMGQARPTRQVTAESFTLVNGSGQVVGAFTAAGDNLPALLMYAPGQQYPAISLALSESTVYVPSPTRKIVRPRFDMSAVNTDTPTNAGVSMGVDASSDSAGITLYDKNGKGRVQLYLIGGEDPTIQLSDADLNRIWTAPTP